MKFFISATTSGLGSYREAVAHKLAKLRHTAVFQEEFEVIDESVSRMLQIKMSICDAAICLVGPAYGCVYPFSEPGKSRLSYTQYEHELARSHGKMVYVFLAKPDAELDRVSEQPPDDAREQREFIERLQSEGKATGRMFRYFRNKEEVLSLLDECMLDAGQRSEHVLKSRLKAYPLPLVRIWDDFTGAKADTQLAQDFDDTAGWLLSFVALAAVQDAAHASGRAVVPLAGDGGCKWMTSRWWRVLKNALASGKGFLLELPAWAAERAEDIRALEGTLDKLLAPRLSADERKMLPAQAREIIGRVFTSLEWLKGYALAGVVSDSALREVRVLRGGDAMPPRELRMEADAHVVKTERLFLFSLRARKALDLWPSLWSIASEQVLQPVCTGAWCEDEVKPGIRV